MLLKVEPPNEQLIGVDFSSSPSRKKPIAVATGHWQGYQLCLQSIEKLSRLDQFENLLLRPGPFVMALDMPFGLSRKLVDGLKWPGAKNYELSAWSSLISFYSKQEKEFLRATFKAWCDARPAGNKFAHRVCDKPAGASPSMKWVNPPVAWMLKEGAVRLMTAGVCVPGMQVGDSQRVAVEAYPGYLSKQVIGRQSYKTDLNKDTRDRKMARSELICALEEGMLLGIRTKIPTYLRAELLLDQKGDLLDAALCMLVAAWAHARKDENYGLPASIDPVEGWIAPVPWA